MHEAARRFVEQARTEVWRGGTVLELGSRYWNGRVRDLFSDAHRYVGVDQQAGRDVDLVCDFLELPEDLGLFDLVLCCEVLEHCPWVASALATMRAHLKPGGGLIITCAGPGRGEHDGGTGYYRNLEPEELTAALAPFCARHLFIHDEAAHDLRFWGVTFGPGESRP